MDGAFHGGGGGVRVERRGRAQRGLGEEAGLRASVLIPPERSVVLTYVDPDGSTCTCTNSERASAELTLEAYDGGWRTERQWTLDRTAHA